MTAIIAEPGDHLMVLNGICIGVHTGTIHQPPAKAKAPRAAKPMAPRTKRKNKHKGRRKQPPIERADTFTMATRMSKFLALVSERPRTTPEMQKALGLRSRGQVQSIVQHLDHQGKLAPAENKGPGYYRVYKLATASGQTVEDHN